LIEDPEEAFRVADKLASDDDIILVTGSFFIVGPALEWLTARESR
jgi:folylpolyglutamate synthase/dihydropteroate synthase